MSQSQQKSLLSQVITGEILFTHVQDVRETSIGKAIHVSSTKGMSDNTRRRLASKD